MNDIPRLKRATWLARVAVLAIAMCAGIVSHAYLAPTTAASASASAKSQLVAQLVAAMTLPEKVAMVTGARDPQLRGEPGYLSGVPRLGIPPLRFADGQSGANNNQ